MKKFLYVYINFLYHSNLGNKLYSRFTVNLQDVVDVPRLLVALQMYSPSSSGNISLIVRVAVPALYFKSTISEEFTVYRIELKIYFFFEEYC